MNDLGSIAIVIEIKDRFFCGFGRKGRIKTAWSLAGAFLFGPWREDKITAIESKLRAKGYIPKRLNVAFQDNEERGKINE
jgi:hypothetical protein